MTRLTELQAYVCGIISGTARVLATPTPPLTIVLS
jgi:hypothetical protein